MATVLCPIDISINRPGLTRDSSWPVTEAARRLGVTRQALSALLNGRAGVSAEMALRLEAALGTSAEMWLEMQAGYDLWQARRQGRPKVESIAA